MLSESERRTLRQIQADLAASDPEFARSFAPGDHTRTAPHPRHTSLFWAIAASSALLVLLSLAAGLPTGLFICASLALGALVCHLNSGGEI